MKKYAKPTITKIDFTMASKFGDQVKKQKIRSAIDDVAISDLIKEYGSPLFVFSETYYDRFI